jgi:hypothetical protein
VTLVERKWIRDLRELPDPATPVEEPAGVEPYAHPVTSIDELVQLARELTVLADNDQSRNRRSRAVRDLLDYLITFPGERWPDRWALFDAETIGGRPWRNLVLPHGSESRQRNLTMGITALMMLDVIRPSYQWTLGRPLSTWETISPHRDPAATRELREHVEKMKMTAHYTNIVLNTAGQILAHTGKSVRQVTAQDVIDMQHELAETMQSSRRGLNTLWIALHQLG